MTGGTESRPHPHLVVLDVPVVDHGTAVVRVLRIDREDKLGALSGDLVRALGEQVRLVRQQREVRAVVLTGTGRGFIAGADVGEYFEVSRETFAEYQRGSREVFDALERLPQPTIAAVNGYAFGGGFEVALCCDFVLASERARFALPEVKLGLIPGGGGTQRLARAVGIRLTKELVMTGRTVRPDEALARGIVTAVVAEYELVNRAVAFASELAAQAPLAVREAKRIIDDGVGQDLGAALTAEQLALSRLFESADGREGIRAFVEKRSPRFIDG